ncbi:MAG: DUF1810 domain-containing protein [Steroidobacteraceae bacterium]
MTGTSDPFNLERFVQAQAINYDMALAELRAGTKRTHWSWYVLPQLKGLGTSRMSIVYAISGLAEARAYLDHPLLGRRLRQCVAAIESHADRTAQQILGEVDAKKYHSCLTLFDRVRGDDEIFHRALRQHFGGEVDSRTVDLLSRP